MGAWNVPNSPAFRIRLVKDATVRGAIQNYLQNIGIVIGRTTPPGFFGWIGDNRELLWARCADPPQGSEVDDGYQPWNYIIYGRLEKSPIRSRVLAKDFVHESQML